LPFFLRSLNSFSVEDYVWLAAHTVDVRHLLYTLVHVNKMKKLWLSKILYTEP
jgi:hypothetical protein